MIEVLEDEVVHFKETLVMYRSYGDVCLYFL